MADTRIQYLASSYREFQDQYARSAALEVADAAVREQLFATSYDGLWNALCEELRANAMAFNDEAGLGAVFGADVYPLVTHVTRQDGATLRVARAEWELTAVVESPTTSQELPLSVAVITGQKLAFVFAIPGASTKPMSAPDAAYTLFKRLVEIH